MSILSVVEATPSRVRGVFRYLLKKKGKKENREILEAVLSPKSLIKKENKDPEMLKKVIRECIGMHLLSEDEKEIKINPEITMESDSCLPRVIAKLLLDKNQDRNRDFQRLLAWFLCQNFFGEPIDKKKAQVKLKDELGHILPELLGRERETQNVSRLEQFEYWSLYLGFAWRNGLNNTLVIDPTSYLRVNLDLILNGLENQQLLLGDFIRRLAEFCPVFETGSFREEIEDLLNNREPNYLSSVTSMALRRLEEEKLIKLYPLSDASSVWVLQDGSDSQISHITWLGDKMSGDES